VRSDIDAELAKLRKARFGRERRAVYAELKELRREYRQRETSVISDIIKGASVVVSTLHGAGSFSLTTAQNSLGERPLFDTIIIDEVSQSLEPQCWVPLATCPLAKRLIVAGDNQQLPPTVKSMEFEFKSLLETTIFDRLVKLFGDVIKCTLTIQYRMNTTIMDFPSKQLYDNKLIAADNVKDRVLCELPDVESNSDTNCRVLWIDTQGDDFPEKSAEENDELDNSRLNENEAYTVVKYIEKLASYGVESKHIGVISPYSAQVSFLKELLEKYPGLEVSTVDGFQGREKEVIIISLVRSNDKREIGFLSDERRINVAITRPKRQLCVIGNMSTVSSTRFLKAWVDWAETYADIEYPDIGDILS
jgi:DNA polymerase alpha-associated DNA helicase A